MISITSKKEGVALAGGIFFLLFALAFNPLASVFSVYDAQRFTQLAFLVLFFIVNRVYWPRGILGASVFLFLGFGFLSSLLAARIEWSLIELVKFLILFVFAFFIGSRSEEIKQNVVFAILVFSALYFLRILVGLLVVLSGGHGIEVLADGFTNHRHFTEFLVAAFSFCAFFLLISKKLKWAAISLLAIVWFVVFFGGARASTIAAIVSSILFCMLSVGSFRNRLVTILVPFFLGFFFDFLIREIFDEGAASLTRTTSSGRFDLWLHGVSLWLHDPFWGVGPMHFAYLSPGLHAHPHNVLIQVLSEWGGIAFLCLVVAFFVYVVECRKRWGVGSPIQSASLISVAGLSANAVFGSVFVVPAVETLFFLLLGLGLSSDNFSGKERGKVRLFKACVLLVFVVCLFGTYNERTADEARGALSGAPRFWQNGGMVLK